MTEEIIKYLFYFIGILLVLGAVLMILYCIFRETTLKVGLISNYLILPMLGCSVVLTLDRAITLFFEKHNYPSEWLFVPPLIIVIAVLAFIKAQNPTRKKTLPGLKNVKDRFN